MLSYDTIYFQNDGKLERDGYGFIDPFWPTRYKVSKDPEYFMRNYGLTKEQVYNLVRGKDKDESPRCLECGGYVAFYNFINGYATYCSNSCRQTHVLNKLWKDPEYRDNILENSLHSTIGLANRNYTQFLSHGEEDDECYLYLAYTHEWKYDWIKFGITHLSQDRKRLRDKYSTIHKIKTSSRIKIAELERKLALKFNGEWIKTSELKSLIKELKIQLNTGNY